MTKLARAIVFPFVVLLAAGPAEASDLPFFGPVAFEIKAGAQAVDVRRSGEKRPNKFEEHSETPEGLVFDDLEVDAFNAHRRSFLNVLAREAGQSDQQFAMDLGVFGSWRGAVSFAGYPTLFTSSTRSPFGHAGAGRLTMNDAVRREIELASSEALAPVIESAVMRAPLLRVAQHRSRMAGGMRWTPLPWLTLRATARDATRNGNRPFATGRFDVTPAGLAVEMFELAQPIEMRTNEFVAGGTVRGARWHVDVDGAFRRFRNTITDVHYDHPFRMSEGIATASPDSAAKAIRASGRADFGPRVHLSLSAMWTAMTQDQRFAPWTLNHEIAGTGLPGGLSPVNVEALPRASLKGEAAAFTTDDSLALALTRNATVTFRYRDYDFANETPEMRMPGYAGGGDTLWRTELAGQPIVAVPLSYRRQVAGTELTWNRRGIRGRIAYERERLTRERRDSASNTENRLTAALNVRSGDFIASATARHARRAGDAALRFDAGSRTRNEGRARMQWTPLERLGIAASLSTTADDYAGRELGMQHFATRTLSLDARWALSERSAVSARAGRSATGYRYAQPGWIRGVDDALTSAALEYSLTLERWTIVTSYEHAAGRQTITGRPRITSTSQDLRAEAEYELSAHWSVGVRYRHDPYALDDYAVDGLSPHPLDVMTGDADARRVLLLDARYAGHSAHAVAVFFRLASD